MALEEEVEALRNSVNNLRSKLQMVLYSLRVLESCENVNIRLYESNLC